MAPKQRTALCPARLQGPSALVLAQAVTPGRGTQVPPGPHRDPVLIILWQSGSARHRLTKVAPRQRVMAPCWIRQSPGSPGPNFSRSHGQRHRHNLQRARSPGAPWWQVDQVLSGLRAATPSLLKQCPGAQAPRSSRGGLASTILLLPLSQRTHGSSRPAFPSPRAGLEFSPR